MPSVKILEDYGAAEGYKVGDVVDITDPVALIAEGKVELAEGEKNEAIEPVSAESVVESPEPEAPAEPEVVEAPVAEVSSVVEETPVVEVVAAPEGSDVA